MIGAAVLQIASTGFHSHLIGGEARRWLTDCHIRHHIANNNVEEHGGGSLMLIIDVR
jgi:hypothetical protein